MSGVDVYSKRFLHVALIIQNILFQLDSCRYIITVLVSTSKNHVSEKFFLGLTILIKITV